jgi:hypothetical protein
VLQQFRWTIVCTAWKASHRQQTGTDSKGIRLELWTSGTRSSNITLLSWTIIWGWQNTPLNRTPNVSSSRLQQAALPNVLVSPILIQAGHAVCE